ncbi:hypothetical protein [Chryseobacterium sp. JAH]|uniref:hypothetical protein n=1 Tax=Chryseobacterium sp. JAH TaxID=1742858 RepID=UPI000646F14A|nr:hypothetical protein [Chryseobacterium sp. JAH]KUJ50386.1 hypothetical protein AR685_15695 [Chryseobacterium sp. JAH]
MKNYYSMLILLMFGLSINAQVGINTDNPKSTLHVQKRAELTYADGILPPRISGDSLRLKEAAYGPAQNGAIVYVTSPATITGPKTIAVISKGLYVYDAAAPNTGPGTGLWNVLPEGPITPSTSTGDGAYAGRVAGTLSLLNLGINLLGSNIQTIPLPTATVAPDTNVDIASAQITTTPTDSYYTIPSTGIYQVNYSYRTGQGIRLELLGANRPGLIITKTATGALPSTATQIDYRYFGGLNLLALPTLPIIGGLSLANIALTQGQISHIYQFTAGDRVRFGVISGGLAAGVLSDSSAEISIYKVK